MIVLLIDRKRRSRQRPRDVATVWSRQCDTDGEHLPHVEELRSRLRALRGKPSSGRRSWLSRRLDRSMNLNVNLGDFGDGSDHEQNFASTESAHAAYRDDASSESDSRSELERVVHEQAMTVAVWEYPDPLERFSSTGEFGSVEEDSEGGSSDGESAGNGSDRSPNEAVWVDTPYL